jgi:uncharacterized membrane protein YkvA (DUF1232 family)
MNDPSHQERQIKPINLGIVTDIIRQARLAWQLMLDPRVPLWVKTIVPASLIYLISPIDFIPDVIPGLGQLDDLAVIIIGVKLFIELCPPEIVREHMHKLLGETNWHVEPNAPASAPASAAASPPSPNIVDAPYEIKQDE